MDSKAFILSQLQRAGKKVKMTSSKNASIVCPFHDDHDPSCSVLLVPRADDHGVVYHPGTFNCYSCGASGGWKKLAERLKMDMMDSGDSKLEEMATALAGMRDDFPYRVYDDPPYGKSWRELSAEFLAELDTRIMEDFKDTQIFDRPVKRLLFPVKMQGTTVGFIKAHISTEGIDLKMSPKYKYSAGEGWIKRAMYPYDLKRLTNLIRKHNNTIILVEGPYDALRLISRDFPATAILGTHSWTPYKRWLLHVKGVERVILLLDGDTAGRQCLEDVLLPSFEEAEDMFDVQALRFPIVNGPKIERLREKMLAAPPNSDEREHWKRRIRELKKAQIDPGNMGQQYFDRLTDMLADPELHRHSPSALD